jgi:hypothetical protein
MMAAESLSAAECVTKDSDRYVVVLNFQEGRTRCVEAMKRLDATARNATYFKLWGKLLAKVARQGKVAPLITKGGLKSDGHYLSIGLKSGPVGAAVEISE